MRTRNRFMMLGLFCVAFAASAPGLVSAGQASGRLVASAPGELTRVWETSSGVTAWFADAGVFLERGGASEWAVRLEATSFTWGDGARIDAARSAPVARGARASIDHGAGVTEWFHDGARGLEHGFVLSEPQGRRGRVAIEVAAHGARVERAPGGDLALLSGGERVLYEGLAVWDADGEPVPASMRPSVGADGFVIELALDASHAFPIVVDPVFAQSDLLIPSDASEGDGVGASIDASDERLVVGARNATVGGEPGAGRVYVYEQDEDGAIVLNSTLELSNPAANDLFGQDVAIDGDLVAVGVPNRDVVAGTRAGMVAVFERTGGGAWRTYETVSQSDPQIGDTFGIAVDVDGEWLAVGRGRSSNAPIARKGAVALYRRSSAGQWLLVETFESPEIQVDSGFGETLALEDGVLVVGARAVGRVYVYTYDSIEWRQTQVLDSPIGGDTAFGAAFAFSGAYLAIGSPAAQEGRGRVHVFTVSAGSVEDRSPHEITPVSGTGPLQFGRALALEDDVLVVGSAEPTNSITGEGAAYRYSRASGVWDSGEVMPMVETRDGDRFSQSLAIDDGVVYAGAPGRDDGGANAGGVYVFREVSVPRDDAVSVTEDRRTSLDVLSNDDLSADSRIVSVAGGREGATIVTDGASITYTSAPDFEGQDSFTYTLSDSPWVATVTVDVQGSNDAPSVEDIFVQTQVGVPLEIMLLASDIDDDPSTLTYTVDGARGGRVESSGGGPVVVFTPTSSAAGEASFAYTATDPDGEISGIGRVTIEVLEDVVEPDVDMGSGDEDAGGADAGFEGLPRVATDIPSCSATGSQGRVPCHALVCAALALVAFGRRRV